MIHISERDTQVSSRPKAIDEFVNTWSIEGFYEEGTAPAELGWGTHERRLPKHAHTPIGGPGNQIFLAQPGIRTFVHSWVPSGGPIVGMVVRHAESFTISDHLTVWEDTIEGRRAVYRPTVHYAYMPCDNAILSLYELTMRNFKLQPKLRIMSDEITDGHRRTRRPADGPRSHHLVDRLAAGHPRDAPAGPGQNATTLQVAAARAGRAGLRDRQPAQGHPRARRAALQGDSRRRGPYLGPCPSVQIELDAAREPIAAVRQVGRAGGRAEPTSGSSPVSSWTAVGSRHVHSADASLYSTSETDRPAGHPAVHSAIPREDVHPRD